MRKFFLFWHPVKYCIIEIFLQLISVMYCIWLHYLTNKELTAYLPYLLGKVTMQGVSNIWKDRDVWRRQQKPDLSGHSSSRWHYYTVARLGKWTKIWAPVWGPRIGVGEDCVVDTGQTKGPTRRCGRKWEVACHWRWERWNSDYPTLGMWYGQTGWSRTSCSEWVTGRGVEGGQCADGSMRSVRRQSLIFGIKLITIARNREMCGSWSELSPRIVTDLTVPGDNKGMIVWAMCEW